MAFFRYFGLKNNTYTNNNFFTISKNIKLLELKVHKNFFTLTFKFG